MTKEERKKLEATGDGLLLAIARLYLRDRHPSVPYSLYQPLTVRLVRNNFLAETAQAEGIRGMEGEKPEVAMEIAIALHYYQHGFRSLRRWLSLLFDRYAHIEEEAGRMLDPTPDDRLMRQIRGALKMAMHNQGGKITDIDKATKQVIAQLKAA